SQMGHSIAHCPRSNRYLGVGRLPIENLKLPFTLATDGLSSNDSLSIFDEMRAALLLHNDISLQELATTLLKAITADAADALKLNNGRISVDKLADFAIVTLREAPKREEEIALWTVLHTKEVSAVFINGEKIL
ncbi:MAG: amidohydrolase family protein, partial [Sulfurovum sp.]|nr:amidohydrolase family protein [Sulfurovum sp.]